MEEYLVLILSFMKLALIGLIACLYALAGRGMLGRLKLRRRWVIPLALCIGTMFFAMVAGTWCWVMLLSIPAYIVVMHIGYGDSSILRKKLGKVGQRVTIGLLYGAASLTFVIPTGQWHLFILQTLLAVGIQTLGIKNPIPASEEETLIGVGNFLLVPFMV